jgi:hypothetical protein
MTAARPEIAVGPMHPRVDSAGGSKRCGTKRRRAYAWKLALLKWRYAWRQFQVLASERGPSRRR